MTRGRCPVCGKTVPVRKDGTLAVHAPTYRRVRDVPACEGTGRSTVSHVALYAPADPDLDPSTGQMPLAVLDDEAARRGALEFLATHDTPWVLDRVIGHVAADLAGGRLCPTLDAEAYGVEVAGLLHPGGGLS